MMPFLKYLLRVARKHWASTLLGSALGFIVSVFAMLATDENQVTQLGGALLAFAVAFVIISYLTSDELESQLNAVTEHTEALGKLVEAAQKPFNARYYSPADRSEVFDLLQGFAEQAQKRILVVSYFSGLEADDKEIPEVDNIVETQKAQRLSDKRSNYYRYLESLPSDAQPRVQYTRIVQFNDFDPVANLPWIYAVVRNTAYRSHFDALYTNGNNGREAGWGPPLLIIKRRLPMTYTLIDDKYLLIQIEAPTLNRNKKPVTQMIGILVINNPEKGLLEQFESVLSESHWRIPVAEDFIEPPDPPAM